MELKQLIRQCPELGDALADFETRLLTLENSMPYGTQDEQPGEPKGDRVHYHFQMPLPKEKGNKYNPF